MTWKYNPFTGQLDSVEKSPWQKLTDSVTASTSKTIDTFSNASFEAVKYIVTAFNTSNTAYKTFELNVLNNDGNYKDTLSHKIKAGGLSIDVDTNNNSGTFELIITNNEIYDVQVRLTRLILI